jgi:hypothetical protein
MRNSKATLSDRIAAALVDQIDSSAVAALIQEVEAAARAAVTAAEQARARALEPTVIDPAARSAMEEAQFLIARLQAALPRLQQRLREVEAAEYAAKCEPDFQQVQAKRDELATELASIYPNMVEQLIDLLRRIEDCDRECSRIDGSAPYGENRRLRKVELEARDLKAFTVTHPSITEQLKLPDWKDSEKLAWPPPQLPLGVLLATSMPVPSNPGGYWWMERQQLAAAQEAEQARLAAFYEKQEREREDREAAEWEARQARRFGR